GGDGASARREDLATLEQRLHARVMLELLEGLEGREARILVIEADDETDIHPIGIEVIDEAAAIGAVVEWPAQGVLDQPGLDAPCRQLPQLFHPERIGLRAAL